MPDHKDGKCFCGVLHKGHPRCPTCGQYYGPGHLINSLIPFRDKLVCSRCEKRWKELDKKMGYDISYRTFVNPLDLKEDKMVDKEESVARHDGKRKDYRTCR